MEVAKGSIRRLAKLIVAGMQDDEGVLDLATKLVRRAVYECVSEMINDPNIERAIENAVDQRVEEKLTELVRENRFFAADDRCGHIYDVKLRR